MELRGLPRARIQTCCALCAVGSHSFQATPADHQRESERSKGQRGWQQRSDIAFSCGKIRARRTYPFQPGSHWRSTPRGTASALGWCESLGAASPVLLSPALPPLVAPRAL